MSSVTSASTRTSTAYRERLELFSGWFEHPIDLPGRWYLQAVDELFRADRFCEGTFIGLGKAIGLGNIACPVSLLAGEHDDITPASQVHEAAKRLATKSADIVHETVPGGHVGLFMSHRTALHPRLDRPSRLRRLEQAGRR